MASVEKQVILLDIDMLLDTRLAVLSELNFEWVKKNLDNGYRYRLSDHWDDVDVGIDQQAYDAIYSNRNKIILHNARMTNIMYMLLDLIRNYEHELLSTNTMLSEVVLVINIHPYDLTDEECYRLLQCLTEYLGEMIKLRIINKPIEELSIHYMVSLGYTQFIVYDISKWLQYHYGGKTRYEDMQRNTDFTIVAPRLIYGGVNRELYDEMRANNVHNHDEFDLASMLFATLFQMVFIPAHYCSIFDPDSQHEPIDLNKDDEHME